MKMRLKQSLKCILCLIPAFLIDIDIFSQLPDGTITTKDYIDVIKSNLTNESLEILRTSANEIDRFLTIDVYIVNNELGEQVVTEKDINNEMAVINSAFWKIGLGFNVGKMVNIPEYVYGKKTSNDQIDEITVKYSASDRINLYLLDRVYHNNIFYYGFTYYPNEKDKNYIFLSKDLLEGNYLITLMGHYFGLLSTHDTISGKEKVNEDNCLSAGDLICDTYADPGLFENVTDSCIYENPKRDPEGEYYIPTVANYMSESLDKCKCQFTTDQYKRMSFYLINYRKYLK